MVILKTAREVQLMKQAGAIAANALKLMGEAVRPGATTAEIDALGRRYIEKNKATPSFLGYRGYPASTCISINNQVIHGIPSKTRVLREGDIVSIDVAACYKGFHGDTAATFPCGSVSKAAQALLDATRESLYKAIEAARPFGRIGDISSAVQEYAEARGYSVVREFVGHGVGSSLHEDPSVPNFGMPGHGLRLLPGMTIAIEPMINEGLPDVTVLDDGWTVETQDDSLSAHFEHTIAITQDGAVILTLV